MKLDPKYCDRQFDRLRGLNYFNGLGEAGEAELRRTLARAPSEGILTLAVNAWIDANTERPTPADLLKLFKEQSELIDRARVAGTSPEFWKPPEPECYECASCQDSGLRGGSKTEPWDFCTCMVGYEYKLREPNAAELANVARKRLYGLAATPSREAEGLRTLEMHTHSAQVIKSLAGETE